MLKNITAQGMAMLTFTTSPIQRIIDTSRCITHQYCNDQALVLYEAIGFSQEAMLLKAYYGQLQLGVVWADQDWKNIHHFLQLVPNKDFGNFQVLLLNIYPIIRPLLNT
ncbi:MAG: hypothetical protein LLG02_01850 [Pelosinus sp.]|nr:hypothetical protein [Pelosinus sp.]